MEEILEEPLDLSIKRAADYQKIHTKSPKSECSSGSVYENEDVTDDESDKSEDQKLYSLLRENPNINGEWTSLSTVNSNHFRHVMLALVLCRETSEESKHPSSVALSVALFKRQSVQSEPNRVGVEI